MPIVNYKINKIEGVRTGEDVGKVDINSNFGITSIKKEKNQSGDFLNVGFLFEVGYTPNLGKIRLEGNLWYHEDDLDSKLTEKSESFKVEASLVNALTTAIVRESLLEVLEISKKLRLPVPIKLPKVDMKPVQLEFKKGA